MSKIQRIEDLEREVDQLHVVLGRLSDRVADLERPEPVVQSQPLVDRVRSEFAKLSGRILGAVGL